MLSSPSPSLARTTTRRYTAGGRNGGGRAAAPVVAVAVAPIVRILILLATMTKIGTVDAFQSSRSPLSVKVAVPTSSPSYTAARRNTSATATVVGRMVPKPFAGVGGGSSSSSFAATTSPTRSFVTSSRRQQGKNAPPGSPRTTTTAVSASTSLSVDDASDKSNSETPKIEVFKKYARRFCNLFPVWTLITAAVALKKPSVFLKIPPSTFTAQIGVLMLCMGISLKPSDFRRAVEKPAAVGLAFFGCYGVMPALAIAIGKVLALPSSLAAGLVLVSCINGAQASNLCTYIGQGDLALSVMMTTMTTIGAIFFTPFMGKALLGQVIPVNAAAIALSTIQVVLAPILVGMTFNWFKPDLVQKILPFSPIVGVLITCLLVGTSVAGCSGAILTAGWKLQLAAASLHALGGLAGYYFTKPFYGEDVCRTFAIEFAMKSR